MSFSKVALFVVCCFHRKDFLGREEIPCGRYFAVELGTDVGSGEMAEGTRARNRKSRSLSMASSGRDFSQAFALSLRSQTPT
jgi:hypothetical protein